LKTYYIVNKITHTFNHTLTQSTMAKLCHFRFKQTNDIGCVHKLCL